MSLYSTSLIDLVILPKVLLFSEISYLSFSVSDTNAISFESPNIGLLEFIQKLGVASSWEQPRPLN